MELIKDNYLRGSGTGTSWHVEIDPPKRKVKSYFEETLEVAEYMYTNKTGRLHLLLSGGLDSHYVFNVFKRLKFDFTPIIIRFVGKNYHTDYNFYDTFYAFELCQNHNIDPLVIKFDFDEFRSSGECLELQHEIKCSSWGIAAVLQAAGMVDGFTVWGNDPPYLRFNEETNAWELEEEEKIHSLLRFYSVRNLQGCPFLLSYTPEMMLSFLLDPHIVDLVNGKYPGKKGTNSTKSYVFNNGSDFNMPHYNHDIVGHVDEHIKKHRIKLHGWELVERIFGPKTSKDTSLDIDYYNHKKLYQGCYKEDYYKLVNRLSIHQ